MQIRLHQNDVREIIYKHLKSIGYSFDELANEENPVYIDDEQDGSVVYCFNLPSDFLEPKKRRR